MNKRSSALARVFAVAALAVALVVAIVVIAGALGGDSDGNGGNRHGSKAHESKPKHVPATYEVKSGDTLIAIAHRMGVSVARIEELNPEIDPQILIAGEQLKLR